MDTMVDRDLVVADDTVLGEILDQMLMRASYRCRVVVGPPDEGGTAVLFWFRGGNDYQERASMRHISSIQGLLAEVLDQDTMFLASLAGQFMMPLSANPGGGRMVRQFYSGLVDLSGQSMEIREVAA